MQQNMIKTDAIFFDVDGTLWDSTEQVAVTWKQVCLEAGLPADHITGERMKQEFGKLMESDLSPEEKASKIFKSIVQK